MPFRILRVLRALRVLRGSMPFPLLLMQRAHNTDVRVVRRTRLRRGDDHCRATLVLDPGGPGNGLDDSAVRLVLVAYAAGTPVLLGIVRARRPRRLHGLDAPGGGRAVLLPQPV